MQTIQSAKHFTVVFCILFLTVVLFNSCKKNDAFINEDVKNKIVNTKKFFDLPANVNSTVARVANALAQQNEKTGFINELANTAGYPVWGKSTVKLIKGNTTTTSNSLLEDYEGGDTCILIPMVLEDGVYVNAFISAVIIDDSVTMRLYYKNDYKAYPFKATQPTTNVTTAEEFAGQMMLFDKEVFDYSIFQVKDKRLFNNSTNYSDTATITRTVKLISSTTTSGTNNLIPACVELEFEITNCSSSFSLSSSNIQNNSGSNTQACTTVIVTVTICGNSGGGSGPIGWPSGGGGSGPGGPGGPGGGGGGTGGGNPPGNCQVGGLIENGFVPPNPCNPGGGNPLPPDEPPISQEQLDLIWMNNNLIDTTNDPCITSAVADLKQISPKLPKLIRDFFIASPNIKMKLDTYVTTLPSCNGNSYCEPEGAYTNPLPSNNNTYDIFINKYYGNATNLSTVATIIHEALHAQLIQYLREAVILHDTARQHQLAALYGYVFTPDFNYDANVYSTALLLTTQHNAMVVMYKNLIGEALYAFAQHKGISITQTYCQNLAWAGLNNTEAFNRLHTSDKDLITEMINAETDPNGTSINSNGNGGRIRIAFGTPCY